MILLKFFTDTCQPCRAVQPIFEKLKSEFSEKLSFEEVNASTDIRSTKYSIMTVPSFVLINAEGNELSRVSGADLSGRKYRQMIEQFLTQD